MKNDNLSLELAAIRNIIGSAYLVDAVRKEVRKTLKAGLVMSGEYKNHPEYNVVISHKETEENVNLLARRLKGSVKNIEIKNLGKIVDGLIGIRFAEEKENEISESPAPK